MDIPNVEVVINFNVPLSEKTYRHRVGRTARAGLPGVALTLITRDQAQVFLELETSLANFLPVSKKAHGQAHIPQWPIPLPTVSGKSSLVIRRRLVDEAWTRGCKVNF